MSKSSISKSKTQLHTTGRKTRTCTTCKTCKDITNFEISKGYRARKCKACRSAGRRKRMTTSPYSYISNLYSQLAYRRKKTHNFDIDRDDLYRIYDKQEGRCEYTGVSMTHIKDGTGYHLSNISIDRINNDLGYVQGNIALVCLSCNMMKYTMELKDLIKWCKLVALHNEE